MQRSWRLGIVEVFDSCVRWKSVFSLFSDSAHVSRGARGARGTNSLSLSLFLPLCLSLSFCLSLSLSLLLLLVMWKITCSLLYRNFALCFCRVLSKGVHFCHVVCFAVIWRLAVGFAFSVSWPWSVQPVKWCKGARVLGIYGGRPMINIFESFTPRLSIFQKHNKFMRLKT